ncbi:hypothetical protein [Hydrogenophaga sp.]|uniref:hypothetical protein n=1 Tax=Hydrogenophaga sp. TaxID=1904254 RepID=UPI003F730F50
MPKVQPITTNFSAGEQSPRLRGRVDLEKYNASAKELLNCVVFKQGGATIRPPTRFIGEVKTSADTARIIPFVFSRTDAYLLELGDGYMRVWKNGVAIESSPGVPYEVTTPYTDDELEDIDYSQGADTMLAAHSENPVQSIKRFADDRWVVGDAAFLPGAVAEVGDRGTMTMTIDNVAVGAGRTITAGASFFLAADVGRRITWGGGVALITAVGGATTATATVETAFGDLVANGSTIPASADPVWLLEGSPQTTCTPSAASPLGAACTLTLTAAGWRTDAVGSIVDINGGLVRVTAYTSSTVISGVIVKVLSGTTGAPADAWTYRKPAWNAQDGYPKAVTFYQQRTWLANTRRYPQTQWGSMSGLFFDFTPGVEDDSAVYKTMDSDEINPIEFMSSGNNLISLTLGGEWETRGGIEKPVTQTNANIKERTGWGCDRVRPEKIGSELMFIEAGGQVMRAIAPSEVDGFTSRDVSVFSEHLFRAGVKSMAFEQSPESVLWIATTDGKLVAMTYNAEQNQVSPCSGDVGGEVEWVANLPEGTYLLVKRTIDGDVKRYIEFLDWGDWRASQEVRNAHDCYLELTGAASATWAGFDHLEGETVSVLADDIYMGEQVVTGGEITLPRTATKVSAGLPYVARIKQEAPEVGTGTGTSQAQAISVHSTYVRFHKTIGARLNGTDIQFRQFDVDMTLDQPLEPFTGLKSMTDLGWAQGEAEMVLEQTQPYPWTVLAIIRNVTVNAG